MCVCVCVYIFVLKLGVYVLHCSSWVSSVYYLAPARCYLAQGCVTLCKVGVYVYYYLAQAGCMYDTLLKPGICVCMLPCSSLGYMCLCVTVLSLGVYVSVCYLAQAGYLYVTLLNLGICMLPYSSWVFVCYLTPACGICVCMLHCYLAQLGVYVSVCYLAQARGI